jgi:calcium-dependent protein kinase
LDHPNISKYYETYDSPKNIYLVMEYCGGVDLFDKIVKNKDSFSEQKAAQIMKCLFLAINHCHSLNIAHRDLKPENIMYDEEVEMNTDLSEVRYEQIKIIDFGLSKQRSTNKKLSTIVGTPFYVAPEVLSGDYDFECDNWSLGVIMHVLVSGYLPFYGQNEREVFEKIKKADLKFDQEEFKVISSSAKDLIKKLLTVDKK